MLKMVPGRGTKSIISSTDTDVVVIAVACFSDLNTEESGLHLEEGKISDGCLYMIYVCL